MLFLELSYCGLTLHKYHKNRHLRSLRLLIPKVCQSTFILIFLVTVFTKVWSNNSRKHPFKMEEEKFIVYLFLIASLFEYALLVVSIGVLIYEAIRDRNKTKLDFIEYKKIKDTDKKIIEPNLFITPNTNKFKKVSCNQVLPLPIQGTSNVQLSKKENKSISKGQFESSQGLSKGKVRNPK